MTTTTLSTADAPGTGTLSVASVLRQAADRIEATGLWQGEAEKTDGKECAYTAIRSLVDDEWAAHPVMLALRDHLGLDNVGEVFLWNDTAPSVGVVTSKLRSCADALD